MLIAALVGLFAGWIGRGLLLLLPFILFRFLAAGGKVFTKIVHDESGNVIQESENGDPEQDWGRNKPLGLFSLQNFFVFSCVFLLLGVFPPEVVYRGISDFFESNQRNPRLILGILSGVLALMVSDLRAIKH